MLKRNVIKFGLALGMVLSMLIGLSQPLIAGEKTVSEVDENIDMKEDIISESEIELPLWEASKSAEDDIYSAVVLEANVYRDGSVVGENVVLVENGEFENYGNYVNTGSNVIFINQNGKRKEIHNIDSNGNQLFDQIFPIASKLQEKSNKDNPYYDDLLQVKKGGKISYIKGDGSYFGNSLQFYNYAVALSSNAILVSDSDSTYKIINGIGEVTTNLLPKYTKLEVYGEYVAYYWISGQDDYYNNIIDCMIIDKDGNTLLNIKDVDEISQKNKCFVVSHKHNGEAYSIFDYDFQELFDMSGYTENYSLRDYISYDFITENYIILEKKVYTDGTRYGVVDVRTKMYVSEWYDIDKIEDGILVGRKEDSSEIGVYTIEGMAYFNDLESYIRNFEEIDDNARVEYMNYVNPYLYITIDRNCTIILDRRNEFVSNGCKIINGKISLITQENNLFTEDNGALMLYTKPDGTIIKNYGDDSGYYSVSNICDGENIDGYVAKVHKNGTSQYVYITKNGSLGTKLYSSFDIRGNYLIGNQSNGYSDVINREEKIIHYYKNFNWEERQSNSQVFCLRDNSSWKQYLYDNKGQIIFGNDKSYSTIEEINKKVDDTDYSIYLTETGSSWYGVVFVLKEKSTTNGLKQIGSNWYMFESGKVTGNYTGLVKYSGQWWYIKNSKLDFGYTGLAQYAGSWWYVRNGKIDFSYTGLVPHAGNWFYIQKGVLNWNYTGLCKYGSSWYYVQKGVLNWNYTGLCKYGGSWYYVQKGILNWNYTGLCKYAGNWFYVQKGVLNWNYTGLCKYGSSWYYVQKGVLNWNYTGLCKYGSSWYYVYKGVLNWNATGLCKYGSSWYYVQKGVVNFGYTGLCKYGGSWYYIQKGVLNWNYTGYSYYGGARWYVKNGVMVRRA